MTVEFPRNRDGDAMRLKTVASLVRDGNKEWRHGGLKDVDEREEGGVAERVIATKDFLRLASGGECANEFSFQKPSLGQFSLHGSPS
uniref:Uncharacterized protein n=1 Tax=Parascaris equorum TaxID=6256 RepID=A0A914S1D5_PAREQ